MNISRIGLGAAVAGAALLILGPALADDPMEATYGNTVVSTDASGAAAKIYFAKDNTFTEEVTGKDGKPITLSGTWALKDDGKTICMTVTPPAGGQAPPPACTPLEKHAVGDDWKVKNDQGQTYDVQIKPGR